MLGTTVAEDVGSGESEVLPPPVLSFSQSTLGRL